MFLDFLVRHSVIEPRVQLVKVPPLFTLELLPLVTFFRAGEVANSRSPDDSQKNRVDFALDFKKTVLLPTAFRNELSQFLTQQKNDSVPTWYQVSSNTFPLGM